LERGGADWPCDEVEVEATLHTLFSLSKRLAGRRGKSQLLAVERLAHQVPARSLRLNPIHAAAAGSCRVPEQETAGFSSRFLDLDPACPGELVLARIPRGLRLQRSDYPWRQGMLFVPSLDTTGPRLQSRQPLSFEKERPYLITGEPAGWVSKSAATWPVRRA